MVFSDCGPHVWLTRMSVQTYPGDMFGWGDMFDLLQTAVVWLIYG